MDGYADFYHFFASQTNNNNSNNSNNNNNNSITINTQSPPSKIELASGFGE